jgi:thiamine biosynthesis protein ThiS
MLKDRRSRMKIILNGNDIEIPEGYVLDDLIAEKKWKMVPMMVKINGEHVERKDFGRLELEKGQNVQIIPFIGGG